MSRETKMAFKTSEQCWPHHFLMYRWPLHLWNSLKCEANKTIALFNLEMYTLKHFLNVSPKLCIHWFVKFRNWLKRGQSTHMLQIWFCYRCIPKGWAVVKPSQLTSPEGFPGTRLAFFPGFVSGGHPSSPLLRALMRKSGTKRSHSSHQIPASTCSRARLELRALPNVRALSCHQSTKGQCLSRVWLCVTPWTAAL